MNKTINYSAAALKKKIDLAIEEGRIEEADQLVQQLLEMQEINETIRIPDDFTKKIIWCGKKEKMMRKMKVVKTAAICMAVLFGISGTALASVKYFQKVNFHDYGFVVGDSEVEKKNITENDNANKFSNKALQDKDTSNDNIDVIDTVQGTKDTKWISKTTSIDNRPSYISDDGINWTEDKEAKGTLQVEYKYADFSTAAEDSHMPAVLTDSTFKKLTLKDEVSYTEYHVQQKEAVSLKQLRAAYNYGSNGIMEMDLQWDKNVEGDYQAGKDFGKVVITGTDKATNQRNYTAKDGTQYSLADNKNGDVTYTTAILSCQGYQLLMRFTGINNDQIEQILDTIDSSSLNYTK